jgi:hypothetical protein
MFKHPFNMTVAGPSQSGKTKFVYDLLFDIENLINPLPKKIIYCYSTWQPVFDELKEKIPIIEFSQGLADLDEIEDTLVIIDDLMTQCVNNKDVVHLFTVGSHHRNNSVIFLTQNIFEQGKYARSISLNSHYLVIFNNLRDKCQINCLARQLYPGETRFFNEVFHDAISCRAYGHLIIDIMPNSINDLRLRSFNFKDNKTFCYVKK